MWKYVVYYFLSLTKVFYTFESKQNLELKGVVVWVQPKLDQPVITGGKHLVITKKLRYG